MAVCIDKALDIMANEQWRFSHLQSLIQYFRAGCEARNISLLPSQSPIQPLIIGDAQRAVDVSDKLLQRGMLVKAIRPPTVAKGSARLRITLSVTHSFADIDLLFTALEEALYA